MIYAALKQAAWRGHLERPVRGIDRLPTAPATGHDLEALAVLWTRDSAAALSHDSALAAYELGDINPSKYHVSVPLGRRIRRAGGEGYVIHHQHLRPEQVTWWEGIRTVTPMTAIDQTLTSGVPTYLVRQAITTAYKKAMIRDADRRRLNSHLASDCVGKRGRTFLVTVSSPLERVRARRLAGSSWRPNGHLRPRGCGSR